MTMTRREHKRSGLPEILMCALVLCMSPVVVYSQEEDRTELDEFRDVLRFGIDSQVVDLLETIQERGYTELGEVIVSRIGNSPNSRLVAEGLDTLIALEHEGATDIATEIIAFYEEEPADTVRAAIRYLRSIEDNDTDDIHDAARRIAEDAGDILQIAAIGLLGDISREQDVPLLMDIYDDSSSESVQAEAVLALGQFPGEDTREFLSELALDEFAPTTIRAYSVSGLGNIGGEEVEDLLLDLLGDDDALLRSYAVSALREFEGETVTEAIQQALLDSFWRVRVSALEALAERPNADAFEAVAFKARRDPIPQVRAAALDALAALGTTEAFDLLRELLQNERAALQYRVQAIDLLLEHDLAQSLDSIRSALVEAANDSVPQNVQRLAQQVSGRELEGADDLILELLAFEDYIVKMYAMRAMVANDMQAEAEMLYPYLEDAWNGPVGREARTSLDRLGVAIPDAAGDGNAAGTDETDGGN